MEKILLVINAHQPKLSSIGFACRLAAQTKSHLTGLFLENLYERGGDESVSGDAYFKTVPEAGLKTTVRTDASYAITLFTRECACHSIATETYVDKGEPIQLVLRESRFADLLILDPGLSFYEDADEQLPSHFSKEILARAECPVVLAPENVGDINEVVFCYDGSASAVFALKQFTYLLPEYRTTPVLLLAVKRSDKEEATEDDRRMMAWLEAHYEQAACKVLAGTTKDELFTYFFMKKNQFVVLGSYGRSALSNIFRHSTADTLIRTVDLPLFITHLNR